MKNADIGEGVIFDFDKEVIESESLPIEELTQIEIDQPELRNRSNRLIRKLIRHGTAIGVGITIGSILGNFFTDELNSNVAPDPQEKTTGEETEKIPFEKFQSPNQVSETTKAVAYSSALKLLINNNQCTGNIINGYLVTASHCNTEKNKIIARRYIENEQYTSLLTGSASKWAAGDVKMQDILIAELDTNAGLPEIYFPYFSNDTPEPGSRMVTSTLPGSKHQPILGNLTFLYEEPAITEGDENQRRGRRWILAIDPDNSEDAKENLCLPGSSGSAVFDDSGHVGVLTRARSKSINKPEDWATIFDMYQKNSGVDLKNIPGFCIVDPLSRDTFNQYIEKLN